MALCICIHDLKVLGLGFRVLGAAHLQMQYSGNINDHQSVRHTGQTQLHFTSWPGAIIRQRPFQGSSGG